MTLQRVRELLLEVQVFTGQGYNRNAAKMILVSIRREHGQAATDQLIANLSMGSVIRFEASQNFK